MRPAARSVRPVIRPASADDVEALADLMFEAPSGDAVAMTGSVQGARAFEAAFLRDALDRAGAVVEVAEEGGVIAGFSHVAVSGAEPSMVQIAGMAMRAMGVRDALRAGWRSTARNKVELPPPPGGVHLVELQVHPFERGKGVGGRLLDAVEVRAREGAAAHISLTTGLTNPARRLYERHGYRVVEERAGERYERITGSPGRVLMVKELR